MLLSPKDAKGQDCDFCPKGERQRSIDAAKRERGTATEKRERVRLAEATLAVVATCDKPTHNLPGDYQECRARTCKSHVSSEPQSGYHVCSREHAPA